MVRSTSNVLLAAESTLERSDSSSDGYNETRDQVNDVMESSDNIMFSIQDLMLSFARTGDPPTVVAAEAAMLEVAQQSAGDMSNSTVSSSLGGISLPGLSNFMTIGPNDCVQRRVFLSQTNSRPSVNVNSNTLTFSIDPCDGNRRRRRQTPAASAEDGNTHFF